MKQVMQTIKNLVLFLFGVVMIVAGYRVNDAQAQAKARATVQAPLMGQVPGRWAAQR